MGFELDAHSLNRLDGVHADLIRVVKRAAAMSDMPFTILEGVRSIARQKQLVAKGASKTMNSRHITGHAVDIAPVDGSGHVSWAWPLYYRLAKIMKAAAKAEGISIEWGGDWKRFKDGPHWQLPWKAYPAARVAGLLSTDEPMTDDMESDFVGSRTLWGAGSAGAGGVAVLADAATNLADTLDQANGYVSAGTWLGLVVGGLIVAGALWAMYARWDDAGRPLPWSAGDA